MGNCLGKCISGNSSGSANAEQPKRESKANGIPDSKQNGINSHQQDCVPIQPNDNPIQDTTSIDERITRPLDLYYKMDNKQRGMALIFNHESFLDFYLPIRKGTHVDRSRLYQTFKNLGFDVKVHNNLRAAEIRNVLEEVSEMDHSDNDCLVITVLTHGELMPNPEMDEKTHTILSHDLMSYIHAKDKLYPLQTIWEYFTDEKCPTLVNKPRIFLVQACQGSKTDDGVLIKSKTIERNGGMYFKLEAADAYGDFEGDPDYSLDSIKTDSLLPQKDFLVAYATLPGFYSFRNTADGSWFIQALCDELSKRGNNCDFLKILTRSSQSVAYDKVSYSTEPEFHLKKQIPCIASMLTKLLVFPTADEQIIA